MSKNCLIVFAKEPEPGRVKTRLAPYLSGPDSLNLYKAFLRDTVDTVRNVRCADKFLAYASVSQPRYLKKIASDFKFHKQKGAHLGFRLYDAFKFARDKGFLKTIIIGSDSPTLPAGFIEKAFNRLENKDLVIGPTFDGGYYLIGLKKTLFSLFKNIRWSSKYVFRDTLKIANKLKKKIFVLEKWYDVDDLVSLKYLIKRLEINKDIKTAKWTRKLIKNAL